MSDGAGREAFYDKVAAKFGEYRTGARMTTEYRSRDPEAVFLEKLIELWGANQRALDAGSGDGRFTLRIAPHFSKISTRVPIGICSRST